MKKCVTVSKKKKNFKPLVTYNKIDFKIEINKIVLKTLGNINMQKHQTSCVIRAIIHECVLIKFGTSK